MYCQVSWGTFKSLPASFTTPGTNYIIRPALSIPTVGRTERNLDLFSTLAASHLYEPILKIPLKRLSFLALLSLALSKSSLCSFSFFP